MLMTGFAVGMILSVTRSLEETPIVEQKTETEEVIENEEMEVAHEE